MKIKWLLGLMSCMLIILPHDGWSQERFQGLYAPLAIQKHQIKKMTVELYAGLDGLDSAQIAARTADYRECFWFDDAGRPARYDATDINIHNQGTFGPHITSQYEYSDNGRMSHRHDSTAFGRSSEWQFLRDSLGRSIADYMVLPDTSVPHIQKNYLYDGKGRLHKVKTTRNRASEGLHDDCVWVFYVYDTHSFNATSLSPMEMARCQCNLEYLDGEARPVRKVVYDSTGTISQTLLLNYDRTGKPIRIESLDPSGKVLHAWVDVVYGRGGLVTLEVDGVQADAQMMLARLGMIGHDFVVGHWADWRLLREVRIKIAGREQTRYVFNYELRN
jgi:hypothetical protein